MELAFSKAVSSLPLRYVSRDWQTLGKDSLTHSFDKLLLRTYFEPGPMSITGDRASLLSHNVHSNGGVWGWVGKMLNSGKKVCT